MITVKKGIPSEEREIFDLDRSDRKKECKPPRKIRVRLFDMVAECLRGKGYVEMVIPEEEEAFVDNEQDFGKINIKEEDI